MYERAHWLHAFTPFPLIPLTHLVVDFCPAYLLCVGGQYGHRPQWGTLFLSKRLTLRSSRSANNARSRETRFLHFPETR
jgi:hypothetical protein